MIIWVIAGLLGLATGLRIGWALVNKQSLVSTAMILALGSLGLVAALNWQPLTLLIDTVLQWHNISMGLSQVALIACAAGSCVMITTVSSERNAATIRKIAIAQYSVAGAIAVASLVTFFAAGQQPEMSPEEYLKRNLGSSDGRLPWLLPLLYVLLALTLVSWAGMRHSNRSRRGRALFVFTVGIVLIVLASAFFFLRAAGNTQLLGVGRGCHPAGLRNAGRRRRVLAAQRRRLVRRPLRAAHDPAGVGRTRSAPSRHRHRGTPPWPAGVPGRRADVADLRRAVLGGHHRRCDAEEAGRRHRCTRMRARRGGRRDGSRVAVGAAGGAGAGDRPVDLRRARGCTGRDRPEIPWTWLAAPARVVFGPRMDPRDRAAGIASSRSPRVGRSQGRGERRISQIRRTPHCGERRANRPGAPGDAAHRPSGRYLAGPLRTTRRCAPQYGEHPRRAYSPASPVPCRASRSTRRR